MKLLFCTECTDLVRLFGGPLRPCKCGQSSGRYLDERRVEISGPSVVLGVDNTGFEAAYRRWQEEDSATTATHFLPSGSPNVERRETPRLARRRRAS